MKTILESELFEAFSTISEYVYVCVCDIKKGISRWSPNAVKYFALPCEYIKNFDEIWTEKIYPEDRNNFSKDIRAVFSGKKKHHDCQYRAANHFGEYVWLESKGSIIYDENGEISIFAGLMTRLDNQNKYDPLTNLLTIYAFHSYDFTDKSSMALLIGIDGFRKVIGNYGYYFGNRVLIDFVERLKEICGSGNCIYRIGGDEFLIAVSNSNEKETKELFGRISEMSENFVMRNGTKINLSVSAGAAPYPKDEYKKDILINNLEYSLDYAKNNKKGNIVFFSDEIAQMQSRLDILRGDLKESIFNNFKGFELYFQPLVEIMNKKIKGCEALLRWKGEKIKDSYPSEFIKILEDDKMITKVGSWVMEQAVRQQKIWEKRYGEINMSFNVSYQQFMEGNFVEKLLEIVKKYDVNPSHMIVELTESCKVENPQALAVIFQRLIDCGFQIALDDFGTAYASLEMLKTLPVNFIKIEHSFVRELAESGHETDYIIIKNLLALCRQIKCKSIIEGVENEKVDKIIKDFDATYLQGYYYSKPVCMEEFEEMLKNDI